MIRTNLPLPFLYRIRLRALLAARRFHPKHKNTGRMNETNGPLNLRAFKARAGNDGTDRLWSDFVDRYELFTEILCSAARNGCDAGKESQYAQLRFWFAANYYRVATRLKPYLDAELNGEECRRSRAALVDDIRNHPKASDFLETLLMARSLRDLLKNDTGALIPLVARISEAVYLCDSDRAA
jgi:hypothetical protein